MKPSLPLIPRLFPPLVPLARSHVPSFAAEGWTHAEPLHPITKPSPLTHTSTTATRSQQPWSQPPPSSLSSTRHTTPFFSRRQHPPASPSQASSSHDRASQPHNQSRSHPTVPPPTLFWNDYLRMV